MMKIVSIALVASLAAFSVAMAEDDPMEFQRCIWRCLANANGAADPAYQACITNICDGGSSSSEPAPMSVREGQWVFGNHPVLGRSAFVAVGKEAIGFACAEGDGGWAVSHRITPGLLEDPAKPNASGVMTTYLGPFAVGGGATYDRNEGGFFEDKKDYCSSSITKFQRSRSVVFINGDFVDLEFDTKYTMTVRQGGETIRISEEGDLRKYGIA